MKKENIIQILIACLISLLSIMYWDMRHDVVDIKDQITRLDSLAVDNIRGREFKNYVDSVQTSHILMSFETLSKKIEELSK